MDMRLGFLFLLAFGFMGALRARQLSLSLQDFDYQKLASEVDLKDFRNDQLCVFCEEYAEMALDYLADNKTQMEIIEVLHVSCSQFGALKKQCITLVDYYASMFFLKISSIEPDAFCQKVGVCKVIPTSLMKENRCELCEDTVSDVLSKLKNPDTQMNVIHTLLKACDSMENFAAKVTLEIDDFLLLYELSSAVNRPVASSDALRELMSSFTSMRCPMLFLQCKKTVLAYAPLLFANTAQFLEKHDVCVAVNACDAPVFSLAKALPGMEVPAFSDT